MPENDEMLTPKEVSRILGKSEETIRQMLRRGSIPGKKIGKTWYVRKAWLYTPNNSPVYT